MSNKIAYGSLISIIVLSIAGNIYQYEPSPEIDVKNITHACIDNGQVIAVEWCDHLSGGYGTRCYQTESSKKEWKVCDYGWKEIDTIKNIAQSKVNKYICDVMECKEV